MRARIFNKSVNKYYISEVYGVINRAGDFYIVDDLINQENVALVKYLDLDTKPPYKVNVEIIDYNPFSDGEWERVPQGIGGGYKEMTYISGDFVENNMMTLQPVGNKQVRLVFNSDWAKEIEIILLSPRVCHLVPGEENYLSDIYDASIFIRDYMVYFFTSEFKEIPDDFDGTYFKSLGMMWRYNEEN